MPKLQKNIVWTLLHAFWIYRWTNKGQLTLTIMLGAGGGGGGGGLRVGPMQY